MTAQAAAVQLVVPLRAGNQRLRPAPPLAVADLAAAGLRAPPEQRQEAVVVAVPHPPRPPLVVGRHEQAVQV